MFYALTVKKLKSFLTFILFLFALLFLCNFFISLYFPLKYVDIIVIKAKKYNLDPAFVCAMIRTESNFERTAVSRKGARGLMQIMDKTALWSAQELGLQNFELNMCFEPETNIEMGCWYIDRLIQQYDQNVSVALAAYNAGSGNVSKWLQDSQYSTNGKTLDVIPFKETRNYIKKIQLFEKIYNILLQFFYKI